MILYLVHGNTYFNSYGYEEHLFGIYTTKDAAENARDLFINEFYIQEMANNYTTVDSISQVMNAIQILELEADKIKDIYLGGYIE